MKAPLVVLYEDSDCLAIIKPAGQFTQGTWAPPGEWTLEQSVRAYLDPDHPESVYVGMPHRLDRPTSGVLLWAKTLKATRRLSTQFERREVEKQYWAVVELSAAPQDTDFVDDECPGSLEPDAGTTPDAFANAKLTWSDWLTRADRSGVVHVVEPGTPGARLALTSVQSVQAVTLPEGCAWLQLWPTTGRTHQLRAQAARRGTPILGDSTYGSPSEIFAPDPIIALHAHSLKTRHPILRHELTLIAPVPDRWQERGITLI